MTDQYLWVRKGELYQRVFYLDITNPPYYLGNNNYEVLNFNPDYTNFNKWNGTDLEMTIIEDMDLVKTKDPERYYDLVDHLDLVNFVELKINGHNLEQVYVIGDLDTLKQVNTAIKNKKKNEKQKKPSCHIL